jgi:hypothetical protein
MSNAVNDLLNRQQSQENTQEVISLLERCLSVATQGSPKFLKDFIEKNEKNHNEIDNLIETLDDNYKISPKNFPEDPLYEKLHKPISLLSELHRCIEKEQIPNKQELLDRLKIYRNQQFAIFQRLRLLLKVAEDEVWAALSWMTQRGKEQEDLIAVKNFSESSTFSSDKIQSLARDAENSIIQHLKSIDRMPNYYQVIGSKDDLYEFTSEVYLVDRDSSSCLVLIPDRVVERIKEKYAIGQWEIDKIPKSSGEKNADSGKHLKDEAGTTMLKIVQFNIPTSYGLKKQLMDNGAEIIEPLGRGEFVVSIPKDPQVANHILNIPEVEGLWDYIPKIDKGIESLMQETEIEPARYGSNPQPSRNRIEILESGDVYFPGIFIVIFFNQKYRNQAAENFKQHQIEVVEEAGESNLVIDLIDYPHSWKRAFEIVKSQQGLRAIEEDNPIGTCNDRAVPLIMGRSTDSPIDYSYLSPTGDSQTLPGDGETIAIFDTGLDTGDVDTLHPDLKGQVLDILPWVPPRYQKQINRLEIYSPGVDISGHGTHVSGSIIGTGQYSQQIGGIPIRGSAHGAKLFFQASEVIVNINEQKVKLSKSHGDIESLLMSAYKRGAKIHSNSWGVKRNYKHIIDEYTDTCMSVDRFMWEHKDFLVVVAAGNEGKHTELENGIDRQTITVPGTAKNCLTIGASENDRNGEFLDTYGELCSISFPHPPFNNNGLVDNIDDIAAFSSRGCCGKQRFKPDVIAPGTFVLSTRSSQMPLVSGTEIGGGSYPAAPEHYVYMSGTSMATPLVAGCAASVRQYLREHNNFSNPSAALVKATIIHSARYLDYQHKCQESRPWVDNEQGWGRVSLANSLNPKDPIEVIFEDRIEGLIKGDKYEYHVEITDSKEPIRIILAYTDYPGEYLINNLNLILYSPKNEYYIGNDFNGKKELDRTNNVQGIVVESPVEGNWRIAVVASNVPSYVNSGEKQDFALVASGGGLKITKHEFYQNTAERELFEQRS